MHRTKTRSFCCAAALGLAACTQPHVQTPAPATITDGDVAALTQLLQFEDTRTYDSIAFRNLAASPHVFVRKRVMLAAGRIRDHAATPLLLAGLGDPSDSVRADAAFALGLLADSSAATVNALGAVARTQGLPAAEALHALGRIITPLSRSYLEEALRTRKNGPEVAEALLAIWHFPRQAETTALIKPFARSSDAELRWRAVYALARGGPDPADFNDFLQWLKDPDALVRSFAARGLRAATADSAGQRAAGARALSDALHDADPHVRINVVSVLASYRDSTLDPVVIPLLSDADLNVRIAAAQALGLLKGSAAAAALETRIHDTGERTPIRGTELAAFINVDPERGVAIATELSTSADWLLRLYDAHALSNARSAAGLALLRTLARDRDARVAAPAVASIAAIAGDTLKSVRALFIEKLAGSDVYLRAEALGGLEHLAQAGDEAIAFDAFERALQDSAEDAAIAAVGVLAKLATNNPAIVRTFTTRFPLSRIRLPEVQRAALRQLKLEGSCCALVAQPAMYDSAVREVLLPALRGQRPHALIGTAGGTIDVELLAADAPVTVLNFVRLAEKHYYAGTRWHRVVPNFVLQDGDPTGTGNGGPGYAIRDEINPVRYLRGTMGMALSGPDTGGSQYFITHSPQPHLDGGYTVFGRVVRGMETADRVIQDDPITSIEIKR